MPRFRSAATKVNTKIAVKNGPFFRLPQNQAACGKGLWAPKPHSVHLKAEVQGPLAAAKLEENRTIGAAACARALRGLESRFCSRAMNPSCPALRPAAVGWARAA